MRRPINLLRRGLRGLWWTHLVLPRRLYRRRIGVQLAVSHLLVIVLTILVLNGVFVAALYGLVPQDVFGEQVGLDGTIGEKARAVAFLIGADPLADPASTEVLPDRRVQVEATLRAVLDDGAAGAGGAQAPLTLDRVRHALVADAAGRVVASSDGAWAPPDQPVESAAFALVPAMTRQVIALDGALLYYQERYVLDVRDRITVASYPLLADDGRLVGAVTLQSEPLDLAALPSRWEVVRESLRTGFQGWPLFVGAAVSISVLVGIWRARAVSRRLSRLAAAADAMAQGDLTRRVPVRGEDEIARLAERFNDMSDRLTAADRARKSFVANVSHELRTPVAIIQGHLERLLDAPPTDLARANGRTSALSATPPASAQTLPAETLTTMHRETVTLSRLIDDLFTLARLEETTLPVEATKTRVDDLVAGVVDGIRDLAWTQRKVTVQSLVGPDVPPVVADRTRTRQILNNLLYNALRHTPEGGLIVVDADARLAEGVVQISVTDTGVGIPPDDLANVFDRFYQGDRGDGTGAGLGLHIVKQLVEAQRGAVAVESHPGRGTVFRFTLPLHSSS